MPQEMTKDQYAEEINKLVDACFDTSLLDLVLKLLRKSL